MVRGAGDIGEQGKVTEQCEGSDSDEQNSDVERVLAVPD